MNKILFVFIVTFALSGWTACSQPAPALALVSPPAPMSTATSQPSPAATSLPVDPVRPPTQIVSTPSGSQPPVPSTSVPTLAPSPTPTIINRTPLPAVVSGTVRSASSPLPGAIIQVQGSPIQTKADSLGAFSLKGISGTTPITLTAWSDGYYVGWVTLNPSAPDWKGGQGVVITLKPIPQTDNAKYPWFSFEGVKGTASCGICHREYKEWLADAHSQSAKNPRFLTVYTGTNVKGELSQPIKYSNDGKALPPDPALPYYGPGLRLDTPNRSNNCATCHTPVASKVPNRQNCGWSGCHTDLTIEHSKGVIDPNTMPTNLSGDGAEGVTCDFCHKIGDVILDSKTGLPLPDMPGILSYRLYRPEDGQQIFFGTLVDVTRRVSYLPLQSKSEFCAPCHYGVFGGVVGSGTVTGGTLIYNSYGEWLDSPYSDPKTGKTCQECHMPVVKEKYYVFPEKGGLIRDYAPLHNHYMAGASDVNLLQNSVTMKTRTQRSANQLSVEVSITNDQTGHHIPTDAPIRSMILVVEAVDANGKILTQVQGPKNPAYSGDYGGKPGKTYAKVLRDDWTGEMPTTAYWRPVTIVEDTRLAALATDTTRYTFDLPAGQAARVNVRLYFRRAFQELAKQKGWTDPDILMESDTIQVER